MLCISNRLSYLYIIDTDFQKCVFQKKHCTHSTFGRSVTLGVFRRFPTENAITRLSRIRSKKGGHPFQYIGRSARFGVYAGLSSSAIWRDCAAKFWVGDDIGQIYKMSIFGKSWGWLCL